ncbi:MAG: hypothetical protein IJ031_02975 [Oscillospiraceae bacterium]|nr:hypothetical protein [Oscillospiraceae bacterium]
MHDWQVNPKAHLCAASRARVIPENEIPPAMRVDFYFVITIHMNKIRLKKAIVSFIAAPPFKGVSGTTVLKSFPADNYIITEEFYRHL